MYQRFGFVKKNRVVLGPDCGKPVPLDIMIRPAMRLVGEKLVPVPIGGRRLAD